MGKRDRKTRWRTLPIGGIASESRSDSEDENVTVKPFTRNYASKVVAFKHQKSTSTSENSSVQSAEVNRDVKITFNEDEYTKITTPRQDMLFKKGYLNKPKTQQSSSSNGTSTSETSTGNGGNGTPDHQCAAYDAQYVYSNGFVDQTGMYYVKTAYEPYPSLMIFNHSPYYSAELNPKDCNEETTTDTFNAEYSILYPSEFYFPPPVPLDHNDNNKAECDTLQNTKDFDNKSYLKPDAEEFIPRSMQQQQSPQQQNETMNIESVLPHPVPVFTIVNELHSAPSSAHVGASLQPSYKTCSATIRRGQPPPPSTQIDYEKIVSKLEAVQEQKDTANRNARKSMTTTTVSQQFTNRPHKYSDIVNRFNGKKSTITVQKQNKMKNTETQSKTVVGTPITVANNQWISVSRKKNRKTKSAIITVENDGVLETSCTSDENEVIPVKDTTNQVSSVNQTVVSEETVPQIVNKIETVPSTNTIAVNNNKQSKSTKPPMKRVIIKDPEVVLTTNETPSRPVRLNVNSTSTPPPPPPLIPIKCDQQKSKNTKKKKKKSLNIDNILSNESDAVNGENATKDRLCPNEICLLELDRMIQKSMYKNLEEKIKVLTDKDDDCFKTIISNLSARKLNTNHFDIMQMTSVVPPKESPKQLMTGPDDSNMKSMLNCETVAATYPVTNAVKEWLRERTPEVALLRNPHELMLLEDTEHIISKNVLNDCITAVVPPVEETIKKVPKHGNLPYRAICCNIM